MQNHNKVSIAVVVGLMIGAGVYWFGADGKKTTDSQRGLASVPRHEKEHVRDQATDLIKKSTENTIANEIKSDQKKDLPQISDAPIEGAVKKIVPAVESKMAGKTSGVESRTDSKAPKGNCFQVQYALESAKKIQMDKTVQHGIALQDSSIVSDSVCVRVNGKVVAYRRDSKDTNLLWIDAFSHPEKARLTVRYCTVKEVCKEACKIEKMNASDQLFGDAAEDNEKAEDSGWGKAGDAAEEVGMVKEFQQLDSEIQARKKKAPTLVRDWKAKDKKTSCVLTGRLD